jgi:hypothetical protein
LASTAVKREANYGKQGLIDRAARQAMADGLRSVLDGDAAAVVAAKDRIISRLNAIFYLGTARNLNDVYKSVVASDNDQAAMYQVEGLTYYRTIQPIVATADAEADAAIQKYFTGALSDVTEQQRDAALAGLNRSSVTSALSLEAKDLLSPASLAGSQGGR